MKITPTMLSLPPYISTAWKNVNSLLCENGVLIVILNNGNRIEIPGLEQSVMVSIFENHAKYVEESQIENKPGIPKSASISFGMPMPGDPTGNLPLHHNPEQKNAPPLPPEILKRIAAVTKAMGLSEIIKMEKPEEHCNCLYCQLTRAVQDREPNNENDEESVSDEDLTFKTWDIEEISEKLYRVINPLDRNESFQVFLGEPIGCTCGQKHCEHIQAVLRS